MKVNKLPHPSIKLWTIYYNTCLKFTNMFSTWLSFKKTNGLSFGIFTMLPYVSVENDTP